MDDLERKREEAMRPVEEAGGGEAEGFEQAEEELEERASHGDEPGDPLADAFTPEEESDLATAEYGEPDEIDPEDEVDPEDEPGNG
jgi:hypothetical protein